MNLQILLVFDSVDSPRNVWEDEGLDCPDRFWFDPVREDVSELIDVTLLE